MNINKVEISPIMNIITIRVQYNGDSPRNKKYYLVISLPPNIIIE